MKGIISKALVLTLLFSQVQPVFAMGPAAAPVAQAAAKAAPKVAFALKGAMKGAQAKFQAMAGKLMKSKAAQKAGDATKKAATAIAKNPKTTAGAVSTGVVGTSLWSRIRASKAEQIKAAAKPWYKKAWSHVVSHPAAYGLGTAALALVGVGYGAYKWNVSRKAAAEKAANEETMRKSLGEEQYKQYKEQQERNAADRAKAQAEEGFWASHPKTTTAAKITGGSVLTGSLGTLGYFAGSRYGLGNAGKGFVTAAGALVGAAGSYFGLRSKAEQKPAQDGDASAQTRTQDTKDAQLPEETAKLHAALDALVTDAEGLLKPSDLPQGKRYTACLTRKAEATPYQTVERMLMSGDNAALFRPLDAAITNFDLAYLNGYVTTKQLNAVKAAVAQLKNPQHGWTHTLTFGLAGK